mgnify:CR=1 FL=1
MEDYKFFRQELIFPCLYGDTIVLGFHKWFTFLYIIFYVISYHDSIIRSYNPLIYAIDKWISSTIIRELRDVASMYQICICMYTYLPGFLNIQEEFYRMLFTPNWIFFLTKSLPQLKDKEINSSNVSL